MKLIAFIGLVLALAGCTTKEMSSTPFYSGHEVTYTGNVENRVNLWPFLIYAVNGSKIDPDCDVRLFDVLNVMA